MKKYGYVLLLGLVGCASNSGDGSGMTKAERFIAHYESSCIDFQNSIIESKTYSTPEKKQEAIDAAYKNYNIAKDASNPEKDREEAINQALRMCQAQKRLLGQ